MQDEACEHCDGALRAKIVTVHYRYKGKIVFIENVPARVCRRCGERYFEASAIETMEAIARKKKREEKTVLVPIRDFAETEAA